MSKIICGIVVCFAFFTAAAASWSQTTPQVPAQTVSDSTVAAAKTKDDRYRIGYEDVVAIQVDRHPDLTQRVPVNANGTIDLFRLDHPIVAICKTEGELADDIAAAYKESYLRNPEVHVVAEQKSQSVAVIGAVEKPGNYFVTHRVHLLEMLALAGGPSKEAGTRMIIARSGSTSNCRSATSTDQDPPPLIEDFKIRDVQEGKQTFWMQPGDVISVLEADIVYVYGNVNKQGAYPIREPITLTQAIVKAEGLKTAAKMDKIRILRQVPGSPERQELVFDLNQIDKGKVKDPYLEPNDIVAVSEDKVRSILLGVADALKNSVPSALYRIP